MTLESYIKIYGKPNGQNGNTWNSLAEKFGFISGEAARSYIKRLNKSESKQTPAMFVQTGIAAITYPQVKLTTGTGMIDFNDAIQLPDYGGTTKTASTKDWWISQKDGYQQRPDIALPVYEPLKMIGVNGKEATLEYDHMRKIQMQTHQNPEKWQPLPLDTVLVIPDLHIPAQHKDALEFCKSLRDKYKATKIIFIGDIVDNYCTSLHSKDPNFHMTPSQEIEVTKMYLKEWHDAFPYATVITGNHDMSRIFKTAKEAMIPKQWLKDIKDVLDTPTWTYTPELIHQGVYYNHGEKAEAAKVAIYRGMSTIQGHRHTLSYIQYVRKDIFAVQVGTLVDRDSMVFDYAKNTYLDWWNGACIIQDGIPTLIPLK